MVHLIKLSTGDIGVVVNGEIIMTADPAFEATAPLEEMAAKVAAAIGAPLTIIASDPPSLDDWSWADVVTTLPSKDGVAAGFVSYAGYMHQPGVGRIQVDFEAPHGATKAETDQAFMAELASLVEINYLAMG